MGLQRTTAPATTPVDLSEAKAHLRILHTDEDAYITGLIEAATDHVEQYLGRSIVNQEWTLSIDCFTDTIRLSRGPVVSVDSVVYDDTDGVQQTLSSDVYTADLSSDPQWIVRNSDEQWPDVNDAVNSVRIVYTAGYATTPSAIKHAILLLVGQWFDRRDTVSDDTVTELPNVVDALLVNYRSFV